MTINAVAENNTYSLAHRSGVQKSGHRVTGQVSVGLTAFLSAETGEICFEVDLAKFSYFWLYY